MADLQAFDMDKGDVVEAEEAYSDEFGFRTFAELQFWDAPVPED